MYKQKIFPLLICLLLISFHNNYLSAQTTIQFAGIEWTVRSGSGGPGPNYWSNSSNSVWVDSYGKLHLKIRKVGSTWYCAEIYAQQSFGYGEYRFYVASNVENYDPNIVVGLFIYENDNREVDIEFSRWGNSSNVDGWYTVQPPPYNSSNQQKFALNLSGDYSTHKFIWSSSNIFFQSYHGHYTTLPSSDFLIKQWTYTGNNNPPVGNERLHINFWLYSGNPPVNQKEAEIIINAIFVPTGSLKVTLYPSEAVSAGAKWNVDGDSWQNSETTLDNLTVGSHTINFNSISGWTEPSSKNITIVKNQTTYENATYVSTSDVDDILKSHIPSEYDLKQNYPNPFNPETQINYNIPEDGYVHLTIYNINGQKIKILVSDFQKAGYYSVSWNGRDDLGQGFTSGVYIYQIISGDFVETKKLIFVR